MSNFRSGAPVIMSHATLQHCSISVFPSPLGSKAQGDKPNHTKKKT